MLKELVQEANCTYTENGAMTYISTTDYCLDLFATIGGLRNASDKEITKRFLKAYVENADLAMKILFFTRDIRGGLGERKIFRIILRYLCDSYPNSVIKNMKLIPKYGRYDDLLTLMDSPCEEQVIGFLKEQFDKDVEIIQNGEGGVSLLGKWLPSVNTSNYQKVLLGRKIAKAFGMSEKEYRKNLSALRKEINIIENYLRCDDYSFDYEKQPSMAMLKYRKTFMEHDKARYLSYLDNVRKHKARLHTETLMPYEIIRPFYYDWGFSGKNISADEEKALDIMWNEQKNYVKNENSLVVVDGSGSMYGWGDAMPALVAQSLGLYFSERNTGAFAGHFITFSTRPQIIKVRGNHLKEKLEYISSFNEVADTNVQAVFELILRTAVKNNVPNNEMPKRIFIISDMEFNRCTQGCNITNFEYVKQIFEDAGYKLPQVVFWNVASRVQQIPVQKNETGVVLVSGCNAHLFEQIVSDQINPYSFMMEVLNSDRYKDIVA